MVLRSKRGERVLKAKDFQLDMLTTAREPDELIMAVRFPVDGKRGVAFREVARRHGDFAIIAVAAVIEDKDAVRLGVGGMAGAPVVRRIASTSDVEGRGRDARAELEGYEDLHASAELRRDILRNLAPDRDRGGATMRRVNKDQKVADQPDAQRPQGLGRDRAAHAAERFPAPFARRRPAPTSAASTASAAAAPC